jgi:hypothetical protein
MTETPPVRAPRIDPASSPYRAPRLLDARRRRARLVSEARRLARRRRIVEAAMRAPTPPAQTPDGRDAEHRLAARVCRLGVALHYALDRLHAADLHEEALAIFRSSQDGPRRQDRAVGAGS